MGSLGDTLVAQGYQESHTGDTAVALGYKWCQQEILSDTRVSLQPTGYTVVAPSTSGGTRYTKVPVEPSGYTLATLVYLWSQPKIQ